MQLLKTDHMKKLSFIFLLGCLLPLVTFSQESGKTEIMMKMLSLKNSLLNKDSVSLSALLADDVTYGHTNGLLQTKQQLIHDVMTGVQDYKSITPGQMDIRVYGNTAVVVMSSEVNMIFGGKPLDLQMSVTLTWVKMNSAWRLVARQSVKTN
jgi:hypothetical protein